MYDETGPNAGKVAQRRGEPVKRPPGSAPCAFKPSRCPKGRPEDNSSLSPRNVDAYLHYLECKATGTFPDGAIVSRNAGIIRMVEDAADRERSAGLPEMLVAMSGLGAAAKGRGR